MPIISSGSSIRLRASRTISSVTMGASYPVRRGRSAGSAGSASSRGTPRARRRGCRRRAPSWRRDGAPVGLGDALREAAGPGRAAPRPGSPRPPGRDRRRAGRPPTRRSRAAAARSPRRAIARSRPSPPKPGTRPIEAWTKRSSASGAMMRQSHARATSAPPPTAWPLTSATVGIGRSSTRSSSRVPRSVSSVPPSSKRVELADRGAGAEDAAGAGDGHQADVVVAAPARPGSPSRQSIASAADRVAGGGIVQDDQRQRPVALEAHRLGRRLEGDATAPSPLARALLELGAGQAAVVREAARAGGGVQLGERCHDRKPTLPILRGWQTTPSPGSERPPSTTPRSAPAR